MEKNHPKLVFVHFFTNRYAHFINCRKSGAVINLSSSAGELPTPQMTVYAATKVIFFFLSL